MLSGIVAIALLVLFVSAWIWAWRPSHKPWFDEAAKLAVEENAARDGEDAR